MLISRDEAGLLGKIAFLGLWQGRFVESQAIFNAVREAHPDRIGPVLGLGMLHIHKGEFARAAAILEKEALALDPDDAHALAWLGLALFRAGRKEDAVSPLKRVLASGSGEEDAKKLAASLLQEMGATA
jgi:cytochrome c-type biogenesis protein CcmH/NrfG